MVDLRSLRLFVVHSNIAHAHRTPLSCVISLTRSSEHIFKYTTAFRCCSFASLISNVGSELATWNQVWALSTSKCLCAPQMAVPPKAVRRKKYLIEVWIEYQSVFHMLVNWTLAFFTDCCMMQYCIEDFKSHNLYVWRHLCWVSLTLRLNRHQLIQRNRPWCWLSTGRVYESVTSTVHCHG